MKDSLLFFTSPIGLGHASRDVVIASKINADITFVSGEDASRMISDYGFPVKDLYKHKGFDVDDSGELKHAFRWIMGYWSYYKRCKKIANNLIDRSETRLVIADEDFAATSVAQENNVPNVVITDILETGFTKGMLASAIERKMNKTMKEMIDKSTLVIIPENGEDRDNFAYVGPIVRDVSSSREVLREQFGFDRKTILVTIGGTNAGLFLINKVVKAYNAIKNRIDADMVIVSGPSLNMETSGIKHMDYVMNLHEMVYASDLLISLAGRSTTDEADAYGTPGIFIPIKNHFEQEENARRHGFSFDDINRLEELIPEKLDSPRNDIKGSNGAARAAGLISNLIK
jgi:UDP-N-acetylglucosamine--N-acetylmuramyl-(pentapeptide) pyrophosphoryl-undecaprenol N-acetylglucosamine transferase